MLNLNIRSLGPISEMDMVGDSSGPEVITLSCSTQLSMKLKPLIKTKMLKIKTFLAFKLSDVVSIMLINVKLPTIWHFNIYKYDQFHAPTQLSMKLKLPIN